MISHWGRGMRGTDSLCLSWQLRESLSEEVAFKLAPADQKEQTAKGRAGARPWEAHLCLWHWSGQ